MGRAWYKKGFNKNWVPPDILQGLCPQAPKWTQGFIPSLFSQPLIPTGFYFSPRKELYSTCYYAALLLKRYECVLLFLKLLHTSPQGFPGGTTGKESACQCRRHKFDSWVEKIPWRRAWQPTPLFLPGRSHGQRSLGGYDRGVEKSRTRLKQLSMHTYLSMSQIIQPI